MGTPYSESETVLTSPLTKCFLRCTMGSFCGENKNLYITSLNVKGMMLTSDDGGCWKNSYLNANKTNIQGLN